MGFPAPGFKDKPLARFDLLYTFPADQITLADGPDGTHTGSLEFDVVASDVFGKLITSVSRTMPFAAFRHRVSGVRANPFPVLPTDRSAARPDILRIGILDTVSNKVGTLEIPMTVGKKPAATAVVTEK